MRKIWSAIGAVGSLALMVKATHNPSAVLWVLFTCWVAAPFLAAGWVLPVPDWAAATVAVGALAIYAAVAFGAIAVKLGFLFLVVPAACWAVLLGSLLLRRLLRP